MRVLVNTFGADVRLKEEVSLSLAAPTLHEVLTALRARSQGNLDRFLRDDLSPAAGCAILVNGRNIGSLNPHQTAIHEGDELTFTVQVSGG